MKLATVLVLTAAFILSADAIANGQNWHQAPFIARVTYGVNQPNIQGVGVIIAPRHIITSAWNLETGFNVLNVWIGAVARNAQRQVQVLARTQHPSYTANPRRNDIGIITLVLPIIFDRTVRPIAFVDNFLPLENEQVTVLGFGGFPGNLVQDLQAAFVRIVDQQRCNARQPNHMPDEQFCAEDVLGRSDICDNDFGAPAIVLIRGVEILAGIGSVHVCPWNVNMSVEPSLYTRVSAYHTWIHQQIALTPMN